MFYSSTPGFCYHVLQTWSYKSFKGLDTKTSGLGLGRDGDLVQSIEFQINLIWFSLIANDLDELLLQIIVVLKGLLVAQTSFILTQF